MSMHPDEQARPQPKVLAPNDAALHAIAEAREAALLTQTASEQLLELFERGDRPAEMRAVSLTAAQPVINDRHRNAYKSIAVWNPGGSSNPAGLPVYVGLAGGSARPGSGWPAIPAGGLLVLPLSDIDIEIGVDPALIASNTVNAFLFFYDSVQPLYAASAGPQDITDRAARQLGLVRLWDGGSLESQLIYSGANIDGLGNNVPGLPVVAQQTLYDAAPAGGLHMARTPRIFKPLSAVAVGAETPIWAPAAGTRFRLMGFVLAVSVAGNVTLRDNAAGTIIAVVPGLAGAPVIAPPMGNGILSAAANNVLTATGPAASTLSGYIYGTEE